MLRNSILSFASRLFMAIARAIVVVVVIAMLGPAEQGMLSVSLAIAVVGGMLVGAGVEVANGYFAANRPSEIRAVAGNSAMLATIGGGFVGAFAWLLFPVLPFLADFDPAYRTPLALSITPTSAFVLFSGIAVGLNRYALMLTANLAVHGTYLIVGLTVAAAGASASLILAGWIVANLTGCVILAASLPRGGERTIDLHLLRLQVTYGARAYATNLLSWLNFRVDLLLVSSLLGPFAAGLYSLAATVAEALLYVGKAAAQPLMTHALGGDHTWSPSVESVYRAVLGGTVLAGLLVILAAPPAIAVALGPEVAPAIPALIVLAIAQAPMAIAMLAASHLYGLGFPGRTVIAGFTAILITIALDVVAIPAFGIFGAATVSLLAYLVTAIIQLRQVRRTVGTNARWSGLIPRRSDLRVLTRLWSRLRWHASP